MLAMKGKNAEAELIAAGAAIKALGASEAMCQDITLSSDEETLTHPLIVINKEKKTPITFPRPYSQISKKPL